MLASATLRDAYQRLSRYQRLITDTSGVEFIPRPGGGVLRHALPGGLGEHARFFQAPVAPRNQK